MARLTFEAWGSKYAIETEDDDLTINEMIYGVVRPLLLAAGWHHSNVDEYIPPEGEEMRECAKGEDEATEIDGQAFFD